MTETKPTEDTAPATVRTAHWPAFDGLRALAILGVMLYHFGWPRWIGGGLYGVDVFFVLSGFLITWLLLVEHDRFNAVSYPRFYARRALRLFPALAMVIVFVVVVVLAIKSFPISVYRHPTLVDLPWVVFYVGNWKAAFPTAALPLGLLAATWSLAVEEQFYLIWPTVLVQLVQRFRRESITIGLVAVVAVEMIARFAMNVAGVHWWVSYNMTITHSDGLLLGCALAFAWSRRDEWRWWDVVVKWTGALAGVGIVGLLLIYRFGDAHPKRIPVWISLIVVATVFVLADVIARPDSALSKALSWGPLVWTGKRSYGMYLWHLPLFYVILAYQRHLPQHHLTSERAALAVVATFVVSGLSYWAVEKRFLQRKVRFTRVVSNSV